MTTIKVQNKSRQNILIVKSKASGNNLNSQNKTNQITIVRGEKGDSGISTLDVLEYSPTGVYTLSRSPIDPSKTKVFINGAKQGYGVDYFISGTLLTWVSSTLSLSITDNIEVYL
jgi:hypothetical protein